MRLAAFVSGGKDSIYATWLAKKNGHEIVKIVSFVSENPDSYMFHTPNISLVGLIAKAMGIPLLEVHTKGEKEAELYNVGEALTSLRNEIDGIVCGAIASNYQMKRLKEAAAEHNLSLIAPLWGRPQEEVVVDEVKAGFDIIITHVAAQGFGASWLGRKLDMGCISDLLELQRKFGVSPVGEGGEFETLVLDCPLYVNGGLKIVRAEKIWDDKTRSGTLAIRDVKLCRD
jgi:ABC transporter with metal-binding/Fe-S-binding domain ATP-binding protein